MIIKNIAYGSNEYQQMTQLRIKVLLEPIGVPAQYIVPEKERNDFFIAAFEENKMIGCCVLTPKENGMVQLRQMAVSKEMQGKKIGAAIIEFAETLAKENGFTVVMMHARNPVIGFYERCGYTISGEEFFEVGIGHHKMQKNLQQ